MPSHKILKILSPDIPLQKDLSQALNVSCILAQVLINRGIKSTEEAQRFLDSGLGHLHDPFLFSDMRKAVSLIQRAARNKEKVMVFGDYDVDGITALVLLKNTLKNMGIEAEHYLPHRIKEGYGLTKEIHRVARQKNIKLLITVDCGTSNHKEVEELRKQNIDVIITDHHESSSRELPAASSIINPKLKDSGYKYRDLAGVGVAYKLCQALSGSVLKDELDLVTLGTIADVVPLAGENRVIVKEGLPQLSKTQRPGLKALIENARIRSRKFNSTIVSFILGPRLNASGRMHTAEDSFNLLMSSDPEEAGQLAKIVEAHNRERQRVENKILEEAEHLINKEINFKEHRVIVIAKEDWHKGVLGIVASKLADRFWRPAIVISIDEDLCKGSGRSIKNFHLFNALLECKDLLNAFGGHAHAAGLSITRDNIEDFKRNINLLAHQKLTLEDLLPSLDIDMELSLSDLNEKVVSELEALEPIGTANPEPLFLTRNLRLKGAPQVLSRETLKFWASDANSTFQVIGFGMASLKESLLHSKSFDLAYTPRIDDWADESSVILEARDIFFR